MKWNVNHDGDEKRHQCQTKKPHTKFHIRQSVTPENFHRLKNRFGPSLKRLREFDLQKRIHKKKHNQLNQIRFFQILFHIDELSIRI